MSSIKLTADSGGGTFELKAPASSGNTRVLTLPDSGNYILGGKILQVVQTVKTDRSSISLATNTLTSDIMTVSITPQSTSSKILLQCTINGNCSTTGFGFVFNRGGTDITGATGDSHGNRRRMTSSQEVDSSNMSSLSGTFLDSPSTTSATTYGVKMAHSSSGTQNIFINHNNDSDLAKFQVTVCTLTAMEVAG